MNNIIETISSYKGQSVEVIKQLTAMEGQKDITFEYVRRPGVALIIPVTKDKKFVLVRQYRAAINQIILEFPAGKQIPGEDIEHTARRELKEETGYDANSLSLIGEFYTAPHFSNEKVFIFTAFDLEAGCEPNCSEHEYIDIELMTKGQLESNLAKESIKDAKSILSLHLFNTTFHE